MEALVARHRKEQRDLQSRITQKKKQATKKSRKGVNDECAALERELRDRQRGEMDEISSGGGAGDGQGEGDGEREGGRGAGDGGSEEGDLERRLGSLEMDREGRVGGGEGGQDGDDALHARSRLQPQSKPQSKPQSHTAQTTNDDPSTATSSPHPYSPTAPHPKKPNRAKARLARRAAALEALSTAAADEAAQTPDRRALEAATMRAALQRRGLSEVAVRPDGHCLYSAFAMGLERMGRGVCVDKDGGEGRGGGGIGGEDEQEEEEDGKRAPSTTSTTPTPTPGYRLVRRSAARYILRHPDDFLPFLLAAEDDDDEKDATDSGGAVDVEAYARRVGETATWGGQVELVALARAYGVRVCVITAPSNGGGGEGRVEVFEPEVESESGDGSGGGGGNGGEKKKTTTGRETAELWLAYYRHHFGLGEHYNFLVLS
ncbi:MAG: hypothetical protein M1819_004749 [Sarea resinae]|nr:MAG: hypothetical protein M1819_004749 [Sarea resinae]